MPAASAVCLHCGFKRRSPTSKAEQSGLSPGSPAISELLRQDLTPEQLLARLRLSSSVYQAQRSATSAWSAVPPCFCSFCHHPLATRNDAHALATSHLAQLPIFVEFYARRLQAQGKEHFEWPLNSDDFRRVGQAIHGSGARRLRLFCRSCIERILGGN